MWWRSVLSELVGTRHSWGGLGRALLRRKAGALLMSFPSAPRISEGYAKVMQMYGQWVEGAHYRRDDDIRPLVKVAAQHLASGKAQLPEIAPCLAIIYFAFAEYDYPLWGRWFVQSVTWILRASIYRGRPMWNDFWMGLWQLSRDPRYIGRLYSHLNRASWIQLETGHWMIGSVCQQDAEFAEHWSDVVRERGEVFA